MKLYLDDVRDNPFIGWETARTPEQAKQIIASALERGDTWEDASLDHDMGMCDDCLERLGECEPGTDEWRVTYAEIAIREQDKASYSSCTHLGDGTSFVRWMIETNTWPIQKPSVHSANPDGAKRMRELIARYGPY